MIILAGLPFTQLTDCPTKSNRDLAVNVSCGGTGGRREGGRKGEMENGREREG